jgi:LysR family glycine cleavage system transcriptional activator
MRKLPPLLALRAFEAAARHLSFKRAADELCVTPTAVSHQIRLLEDFCGQPLFRRRPSPLALTVAGERLFPVVRDGFDAFAAAAASLSATAARAPLRLTAPDAFAGRWLVRRLPAWRKAHPDVPLEIIGTNRVLDLRADEADVAIRYSARMPEQLAGCELFRDRYFPVCRPELLARGRPIERPADLLEYPLIHFAWRRPDASIPDWRRWLAAARAEDPAVPEVARADLSFREELHAIAAVLAGQGIAICSDVVIGDELKSGELVRAHSLSLPGYGFYLVHVPDHPRRQTIGALLEWLRTTR